MNAKHVCSYQDHADLIGVLRSEGKYGEQECPRCHRATVQVGPPRCPHGSLIEKGKTLCESCKTGPGDSRVSPEQVAAFLRDTPAIPDSELQAHESQETNEEIDTALMAAEI